jgi:(p)ppGpp synthase/HD superfamily hydrolase
LPPPASGLGESEVPLYSKLLGRATAYAATAHRDQLRKDPSTEVPYIHHSVMVGFILQRAGFDEEVVAAGILHDVLEDTSTTLSELTQRFGERIAFLVDSVSERDKSLPWENRKSDHLELLRKSSKESLAIAAADKIHNINTIIEALGRGVAIWQVFKRGRTQQLDLFAQYLNMFKDSWDHPLVNELETALSTLRAL